MAGFETAEQALTPMVRAIEAARLRPEHDMAITVDVAASSCMWRSGVVITCAARRDLTLDEMMSYVFDLCGKYPIVSVEDRFEQDDWDAWQRERSRGGNVLGF